MKRYFLVLITIPVFAQPSLEDIQANYCLDLPESAVCAADGVSDLDGFPDVTNECPNDASNLCDFHVVTDSDNDSAPDKNNHCTPDPINMCHMPISEIGDNHGPGDLPATIPAGQTAVWAAGNRTEGLVVVEGTLQVNDGVRATLRGIYVKMGGRIIFCSEATPCTNTSIKMVGDLNLVNDPYQWFPGFVVAGDIQVYGKNTGINPIYAIPDLHQGLARNDSSLGVRINSISTDPDAWVLPVITVGGGKQVSLRGELVARGLPTTFNLTKGVEFEGGHFAMVHMATWRLDGLALKDVGRTTVLAPDDTLVLDDGTLHVGNNVRGRYALHWHHVMHQNGGIVKNIVVNGGQKWGIVVHGTDNVTIEDALVWNVAGAGVTIEGVSVDGAVFRRIISAGTTGVRPDGSGYMSGMHGGQTDNDKLANGKTVVHGGFTGDGFWFEYGLGWTVEDSMALGNKSNGYFISSYWRKPRGEDADKSRPMSFQNNVAWGNETGLWITWDQGVQQWPYVPRTYDFSGFYNQIGIKTYHTANLTFTGEVHADPVASAQSARKTGRFTTGVHLGNPAYENGGHVVLVDVSGYNVGIQLPPNTLAPKAGASGKNHRIDTIAAGDYGNDVNVVFTKSLGAEASHVVDINRISGASRTETPWRDSRVIKWINSDLLYLDRSDKGALKYQTNVKFNGDNIPMRFAGSSVQNSVSQ